MEQTIGGPLMLLLVLVAQALPVVSQLVSMGVLMREEKFEKCCELVLAQSQIFVMMSGW